MEVRKKFDLKEIIFVFVLKDGVYTERFFQRSLLLFDMFSFWKSNFWWLKHWIYKQYGGEGFICGVEFYLSNHLLKCYFLQEM